MIWGNENEIQISNFNFYPYFIFLLPSNLGIIGEIWKDVSDENQFSMILLQGLSLDFPVSDVCNAGS